MSNSPDQNEHTQQITQPQEEGSSHEVNDIQGGSEAAGVKEAELPAELTDQDSSDRAKSTGEGRRSSEDEVDGVIGGVEAEAGNPSQDAGEDVGKEEGKLDSAANEEDKTGEPNPPSVVPEADITEQAAPSPSKLIPPLRAATPSSRTSTPPLTNSAHTAAKKFSSINVNKKFLSKTGSPSPANAPGSAKLNILSGRPSASPVPIAPTSSRLLSTTLTTVTATKPSTSPQPPASASSSPWAKPAPVLAESVAVPVASGSSQPPLTKARVLTSSMASMGQGQGIIAPKAVWKTVTADGKRPILGLSREFPTAKEVAEGKQAAALAVQAQAAHNQAILQGLSAFTQLDPNAHRWDDDDDDDDVIDFGDGTVVETHHLAAPQPETAQEPVPKNERFAEDFDRSWPKRPPAVLERESQQRDGAKVLFNANLNRMEPPNQARPPPPAPTRLMSRGELTGEAKAAPNLRPIERAPLPSNRGQAADGGRMLPPHMATAQLDTRPTAVASTGRPSWGAREERQLPPHLADRRELPVPPPISQQARSPSEAQSNLPSRHSFGQGTAPPPPPASQPPEPTNIRPTEGTAPSAAASTSPDAQTAEMHTAAEKARLRRLAEEAEREAAAERARRKAKELEEKLGLRSSAPPSTSVNAASGPPGLVQQSPPITIAQRPKPNVAPIEPSTLISNPVKTIPGPAGLPHKPHAPDSSRTGETWRARLHAAVAESNAIVAAAKAEPAEVIVPESQGSLPRRTAESYFEANEPQSLPVSQDTSEHPQAVGTSSDLPNEAPKRESTFDDMLGRIKAAMEVARINNAPQPTAVEVGVPPSSAEAPPPARTAPQPTEPETPASSLPFFFDITQTEIPRSPPPAWRSYIVRLPKTSRALSPVRPKPTSRMNTPESFLLSFNPPLSLNPNTLSRAEYLIPPLPRARFAKSDPVPIVSISPRQFQPYPKKKRKSSPAAPRVAEIVQPEMASQILFEPQPSPPSSSSAARTLQAQPPIAQSAAKPVEPISTQPPSVNDLMEPQHRSRSPVKASPAAKAEREGRFAANGVGLGMVDRGLASAPEIKTGVRFMVSSELEGDSLLDEINKMSLETVDEAETRAEVGKTLGSEGPKTPPLHTGSSGASRTHPPSPNGNVNSTPWSTQQDRLKSMWGATAAPATDPVKASQSSTSVPDITTPLYPSLNAPSSADPPASQPLQSKGSFASQTFSPTSSSFSAMRASPNYTYLQQGTPDNMMGLSYNSLTRAQSNSNANGFTTMPQQGVWSPSAFNASMTTPGYGYSAKTGTSAMDHKAAMAFHAAPSAKESASQYGYSQHQQQHATQHSPHFSTAYMPNQYASPTQAQGRVASGAGNGTAGTNQMYGYGYSPASGVNRLAMNGRFGQAVQNAHQHQHHHQQQQQLVPNGIDYGYASASGVEGGYYGSVGYGGMSQSQPGQSAASNQAQRGGASRKMW